MLEARRRLSRNDEGADRIYPLLRATPLSKFLTDAQLGELEPYGQQLVRKAGLTLYRQGDPAETLFIVVRGAVELRARPPGRRVYRTIEVVSDGCTVGDESVVGEDRYLTSARVQEQAHLLAFPKDELQRLAASQPQLMVALVQCAGGCLIQMVRRSAILTQAPADVALELLLRELSRRDGEGGAVRITHAQLAGLLHLSRETVSRNLGQMASEGLIELSRGVIRLRDR